MQMAREISIGSVRIGGNQPLVLIAGPCVIESEGHAVMMAERLAEIAANAKVPSCFQGFLRQGQSFLRTILSRAGTSGRSAHLEKNQGALRDSDPDGHSRSVSGGSRGRGRRRPANSRVSFAADGSACRGGKDGPRGELEKGTIPFAVGNGQRRGESRRRPATIAFFSPNAALPSVIRIL